MPYPAESVTSFPVSVITQYLDQNSVVHNYGVTYNVEKKYNIHDACAKASRVQGFRLCRPWNKTFGRYKLYCDGSGGYKGVYSGGVFTVTMRPLTGLHAWGSTGQVHINALGVPALAGSNIQNATLVKALNKLKSQDVHIGNFLGESHKTFAMVGNAAKSIAQSVTQFRGKYPKDWAKVVATQVGNLARKDWHTIPNSWLALQYGWKPLMSDIYGTIHHLYRRSRFDFPYARATAYNFDVVESKTQVKLVGSPTFDGASTMTQDVYYNDKQECWVSLTYGLSSPLLAELSSLGLLNPLEIVWELTRFSFVVDWFLPIGSWLSALTADAGFNFITGSMTRKTVRSDTKTVRTGVWPTQVTPFPGTIWYYGYPSDLIIDSTVGQFSRTCYTTSPFPGLYVKNPLNFAHVANGLSLLTQAFK